MIGRLDLRDRIAFLVWEHDLAAIAKPDETAQRPRLLDELLGRRKVTEDLLIEPDEDPADRLADRPATLLRHAAAEADATASTSGPLRRIANAAKPATMAIQPAATNAAA